MMAGLLDSASGATLNVIPLRHGITDRDIEYLDHWMRAGQRMGLHDSQVCHGRGGGEPQGDYIVLWVRENADPAYIIAAEGLTWKVADMIRGICLGSFRTIGAALHFIRPVLQIGIAVLLVEQLI